MEDKITVELRPFDGSFAPKTVPAENPRVYVKMPGGYMVFIFTSEGLVIDHWYENDKSEETCDTFSMTYSEIVEELLQ